MKATEIWAAVEGGGLVDERLRSAKESAKRPVFGSAYVPYIISSVHEFYLANMIHNLITYS